MRRICFFAWMVVIGLTRCSYADEFENSWESYNNKVIELYHDGQYDQALVVGQKAFQLAEGEKEISPLNLATTLCNMGVQHKMKGEYDLALRLYERALEINVKVLGEEHIEVANVLLDMALLYNAQRNYTQAEAFYKRALTNKQQQLGEVHVEVASVLNSLGNLYATQRMYIESVGFYKKALSIDVNLLGLDHEYVINDIQRIESIYMRTGRRKQLAALKLKYRLPEIQKRDEVSVIDHPTENGLLIDSDITKNGIIRRIGRNADDNLQPVPNNTDSFGNEKLAMSLEDKKGLANSDDAQNFDEETFHSMARAFIILQVKDLGILTGDGEFLVKKNPEGEGCFVYHTNYTSSRILIWWVIAEDKGYPLNAPSKRATPELKWARDDGLNGPSTHDSIAYVFYDTPMPPYKPTNKTDQSNLGGYTVKQYSIYRHIMDTPMSVGDEQAIENAARRYGVTASEAKETTELVMKILLKNEWYGSAEGEIKHATDWKE